MGRELTSFPFEVSYDEVLANLDEYVNAVYSCLESEFMVMPKGEGFVEYPVFESGYEALKKATDEFSQIEAGTIFPVVRQLPITLIVLRTMLGFTPPEWAYVASERTGVTIGQGFVRSLDRSVRMRPLTPLSNRKATDARVHALVEVACHLLVTGPLPAVGGDRLHRLDKADTREGADSIRAAARVGVPYAMLLYERLLGRPFAGHRDSLSEAVGDTLEAAVEDALIAAGVGYRKTKRAERLVGFDQAPDFIIPDEFNPQVVIEAKIAQDDGTARDKITRVQHLAELSTVGQPSGEPKYEVVACIGGRGFGVRREDMKKLLRATRGKVFCVRTLDKLVQYTRLREFRSR